MLRPDIEEVARASINLLRNDSNYQVAEAIVRIEQKTKLASDELSLISRVSSDYFFSAFHFLPEDSTPKRVFNYVRAGMEQIISMGNNNLAAYLTKLVTELPSFQLKWLEVNTSVDMTRGQRIVEEHPIHITSDGLQVYREISRLWDKHGKSMDYTIKRISVLSRLPNGFLGQL